MVEIGRRNSLGVPHLLVYGSVDDLQHVITASLEDAMVYAEYLANERDEQSFQVFELRQVDMAVKRYYEVRLSGSDRAEAPVDSTRVMDSVGELVGNLQVVPALGPDGIPGADQGAEFAAPTGVDEAGSRIDRGTEFDAEVVAGPVDPRFGSEEGDGADHEPYLDPRSDHRFDPEPGLDSDLDLDLGGELGVEADHLVDHGDGGYPGDDRADHGALGGADHGALGGADHHPDRHPDHDPDHEVGTGEDDGADGPAGHDADEPAHRYPGRRNGVVPLSA